MAHPRDPRFPVLPLYKFRQELAEFRTEWADESKPFARMYGRGVHTRTCTAIQSRIEDAKNRDLEVYGCFPTMLTAEQARDHKYKPCRWCQPDIVTKPARKRPEREVYHGEWAY